MVYTGTKASPSEGSDLARADVIVSGGRGIRDAQNYKYIEMLAKLFPRSATGGSRPICDYKWIPYSKQVGITGATVSLRNVTWAEPVLLPSETRISTVCSTAVLPGWLKA